MSTISIIWCLGHKATIDIIKWYFNGNALKELIPNKLKTEPNILIVFSDVY